MGSHARLSPSASERWKNCPGSVHLSEQVPPPKSSEYAEEGTTAHELSELKLRKFMGEKVTAKINKVKKNEYYCGEMEEATDFYKDVVIEKYMAAGESAELMVEQKFSLDKYVPEGFGSSDAVIISEDAIEVVDLKYGKGIRVSAKGNPQLRLYGLGAAGLFGDLYDFTTVRMTIIQPRLDHVSTEEISLKDLEAWANEEIVPQAKKAMDNIEEYACGDWCRFCPASAVCRTRAEANLELARMDFRSPNLLTEDEIGEVLAKADELSKWVKDVEGYALDQAVAGTSFKGYKLVEGRSIRKYADELKVVEALKKIGFDEAMLYQRKLNGITDMEKLVGKKKLTETLGDLLIKPPGKPVLVPVSDKREAISVTESAKADFND